MIPDGAVSFIRVAVPVSITYPHINKTRLLPDGGLYPIAGCQPRILESYDLTLTEADL